MTQVRAVPTKTKQALPWVGHPYTEGVLANGLRVIIVENHAVPVLTFQTWFNVGSKHEKLDPQIGATGIAHLFEHMMFRGTETVKDGEFDSALFSAGATDQNATTWVDRTNYYQSVPKHQLDLVLRLESDRLANLRVADHFETERGAVLGELNMVLDDPESVAYEKLYESAYQVHPYRFSTIGTEREIKSFTAQKAIYFYRKYYSPNNACILIVGDVDAADALYKIEKYYGNIPRAEIEWENGPAEPRHEAEIHQEFEHAQLAQEKLLLAYHAPSVTAADFPALWIAQSVLSLGEGSVLQRLWIDSGSATGLQGDLNQFKDPGLLTLAADIQPGHEASQLVSVLDLALAQIQSGALSIELERARNQLLLQIFSQWDDNASLASFMGEYYIAAGDAAFGFSLVEKLKKVETKEVLIVMKKYLVSANRTVLVGKPPVESEALEGRA